MATRVDVLTRARDLLTEFGWAKGWFAVDASGQDCACLSREAQAFCPLGALTRAAYELDAAHLVGGCEELLRRQVVGQRSWLTLKRFKNVADWNDSQRDKRNVLETMTAAIEEAREYEGIRS